MLVTATSVLVLHDLPRARVEEDEVLHLDLRGQLRSAESDGDALDAASDLAAELPAVEVVLAAVPDLLARPDDDSPSESAPPAQEPETLATAELVAPPPTPEPGIVTVESPPEPPAPSLEPAAPSVELDVAATQGGTSAPDGGATPAGGGQPSAGAPVVASAGATATEPAPPVASPSGSAAGASATAGGSAGLAANDLPIDGKALRVRRAGRPAYPDECRRRGEQGSVTCRLTIDRDGEVVDVLVVTSSGFPVLDAAAVRTLLRWRFEPLARLTTREQVHALQRLDFELRDARH